MAIKNRNEKLDFLHKIKKEVDIHSLLADTLPKLGFKDVYDIVELYPYMFLMCEDIFKEKVNSLINKLGIEYLSILEENTTLWGGVEIDK